MNEETTPAAPQPPATPPAPPSPVEPPVPDDLAITDCIEAGDPDLDLACAGTVGDLRDGFERWYDRIALSAQFGTVVFAAQDGRLLAAEVGLLVRPAMPEEVRDAVESAKEWERYLRDDRLKELDGYAERLGA